MRVMTPFEEWMHDHPAIEVAGIVVAAILLGALLFSGSNAEPASVGFGFRLRIDSRPEPERLPRREVPGVHP